MHNPHLNDDLYGVIQREESKYLISSELLYLGSVLVVMIRIVFNPNASTSHRPESKDIQCPHLNDDLFGVIQREESR
jgi:hypothetical protein